MVPHDVNLLEHTINELRAVTFAHEQLLDAWTKETAFDLHFRPAGNSQLSHVETESRPAKRTSWPANARSDHEGLVRRWEVSRLSSLRAVQPGSFQEAIP